MNNKNTYAGISIDIVVPVYNEEDTIQLFHQQLTSCIDGLNSEVTIYYVDDGSSDQTCDLLRAIRAVDTRVIIVELSRNFGHQAAITAGIDLAEGDAVITMDGDGQHPAELIPQMLELFQNGYDIVLTQRAEEGRISFIKKLTASIFYRLMNWISDTNIIPGSADFRLMSRKVVHEVKQMREYHRFLRGMISWMGYRTVILPYSVQERLGGKSKYSFRKMIRLSMDAAFSFSLMPLYLGVLLGVIFLILAFAELLYVSSFWLSGNQDLLVRGWSSLMFILLLVGGTLAIILGIIGIYVGYIFQEVKRRPIYLIRRIIPEIDADD
jgi:glycosyltransferase involved in cell wall biosynthesis